MRHKFLFKSLVFFSFLTAFLFLFHHAQAETLSVKRVIDGDTLLLSNGEKVRLIGVDTPESHESKKLYRDARKSGRDIKTMKALGKKATRYTKKLAHMKKVRIEFDQANAHINHRDRDKTYEKLPFSVQATSNKLSEGKFRKAITSLRKSGFSVPEISRFLGVSENMIRCRLK